VTEVRIITPQGMFGGSADEDLLTTAMRVTGCGFGEEGDWCSKYGCNFENDVFVMRRYYWGDCDCGGNDRSKLWYEANPHAVNCWQAERDRRWKRYDESVGWSEIEGAAFSVDVLPDSDAMDRWREAYRLRDAAHAGIVRDLYAEFGMEPQAFQYHCTCGRDERARDAGLGHLPECSGELPNFLYKPTGFRLEWYKYIGRDMEFTGDLPSDFMTRIFDSHPSGMTLQQAIEKTANEHEQTAQAFADAFASLGGARA
jgi:hypothetical protein